jgi:7-cyano-7-deazaguanine synthase
MSDSRTAVVLLSGGLDSATVLALARRDGWTCHALTVAYGQWHGVEIVRARELARVLGVAAHRVVEVDLASFGGSSLVGDGIIPKHAPAHDGVSIPSTYVPARNTVFLSLALAWAEVLDADAIFLGVNAVDFSGYPDCRPAFVEAFQQLAAVATRRGLAGRPVRIEAPLLHLSKAEIVSLGRSLGLDYALTTSCYDPGPDGRPCGACDSCRLRREGFAALGLRDPLDERYEQGPPTPGTAPRETR